jgi:hypothetical protein
MNTASALCCQDVGNTPHLRFNFNLWYPRVELIDLDTSLNSNYPILPLTCQHKHENSSVFLCCLRALLGSTAQKLRAYGVGPRESASYTSYRPSYGLWAQEIFQMGYYSWKKG